VSSRVEGLWDENEQEGLRSFAVPREPGIIAGDSQMSIVKIFGLVLIVAGVLGLAYSSFSYTTETHKASIGSLEVSMKEKETVNVPVWAGVGAIVVGGALLLVPSKS
jgi:hypothetical protein